MKWLSSFLQQCGLRCSKCGSWRNTKFVSTEHKFGTNLGNILLMDPYYIMTRTRECDDCHNVLSSHTEGIKEL